MFGDFVNTVVGGGGAVIDIGGGIIDKGAGYLDRGEKAADNLAKFGERASNVPNQVLDVGEGIFGALGGIGDWLPWIIGGGLVIGAAGVYVQMTRKN